MDVGSLSCRTNFESVSATLLTAFAFSTLPSTHHQRHPSRAAFSIAGGWYDIATFRINTLTNDLGAACIPVVHYLRETDVITVPLRLPTCWLQPISAFGCSFVNGTSRRQFTLHSPYHSILAPVRLSTGSYDFPHGSSYTGFIVPGASHHLLVEWPGRILEAELQVVLHLKKVTYNIYLCNFVSQITPASAATISGGFFASQKK
jgi:hypothetical protein